MKKIIFCAIFIPLLHFSLAKAQGTQPLERDGIYCANPPTEEGVPLVLHLHEDNTVDWQYVSGPSGPSCQGIDPEDLTLKNKGKYYVARTTLPPEQDVIRFTLDYLMWATGKIDRDGPGFVITDEQEPYTLHFKLLTAPSR